MTFINDIYLNLNKTIINIFEWEEKDNLKFFKKVPIIKVSSVILQNFTYNKIKINLKSITNYLYNNELPNNEYILIITDLKRALAIIIEDEIIKYKSYLQLEDEDEVFSIVDSKENVTIDYSIIRNDYIYSDLTRKEKRIKNILIKELEYLYTIKDLNKLKYYYYEYFNKESNDLNKIYNKLIKSLNNFNNKHLVLYNISKSSINNK